MLIARFGPVDNRFWYNPLGWSSFKKSTVGAFAESFRVLIQKKVWQELFDNHLYELKVFKAITFIAMKIMKSV